MVVPRRQNLPVNRYDPPRLRPRSRPPPRGLRYESRFQRSEYARDLPTQGLALPRAGMNGVHHVSRFTFPVSRPFSLCSCISLALALITNHACALCFSEPSRDTPSNSELKLGITVIRR